MMESLVLKQHVAFGGGVLRECLAALLDQPRGLRVMEEVNC